MIFEFVYLVTPVSPPLPPRSLLAKVVYLECAPVRSFSFRGRVHVHLRVHVQTRICDLPEGFFEFFGFSAELPK